MRNELACTGLSFGSGRMETAPVGLQLSGMFDEQIAELRWYDTSRLRVLAQAAQGFEQQKRAY